MRKLESKMVFLPRIKWVGAKSCGALASFTRKDSRSGGCLELGF